ncbi:transcriptional regulator GcvA [Shinella sp. CPCC 101442]|uniref:transcriptional regulator GcvA n=1 Tax=Shinella sp. CPCC 101442 TaxID=2932265 RepID=UPI002152ABEA|nr:transcriptional regulator GcvA [Shinella sp. CPCC 101442]MCR6497470.1 transcriptional regulator GcvA [Shinella sp. CPCC 101442]
MADRIGKLPSLNGVRVFEVVARHLNFRLAAEELGVTQGAVAQQIRGLEAELGLKLFERHPRALAITEAGRSYVGSIRRAFELISEATETLRPEPQHLTISVTPTFASKWLIPRLPDFTAVHPEIDLRILATDRIANFQTDAVDLAVRYGRPSFGPGLQADLLFEHIVVALGSPLLIDKLGRPEIADNLAAYALLHDAHNFWPQFLEHAMGKTAPVMAAKNIRFNQTSLALEAAIGGQGLALASSFFIEEDIAAGRLMRLFETELRVGGDFYIVAPRKPRHAASVEAVRGWLLRESAKFKG